jgi:hypothetical protein
MRTTLTLKQIVIELAALVLVVAALALPRGKEIAHFATTDEHLWLYRAANFYYALSHGDYAATYQKEHPGVTVMWAGALGFLRKYPEYKDNREGLVDPDEFHAYMARRIVKVTLLELLREGRLMVAAMQVAVLTLCYIYARRLFGLLPALAGMLLVAFDPFYLGLTRLLHLDGLMASFLLLSILAYLTYLSHRRMIDLLVSGAAAGLACLTKIPALFIVPVVGLLALWAPWQAWRKKELTGKVVWGTLWPLAAWFAAAAITFVALFPAMWVAPAETLAKIFGTAQEYAEAGHGSSIFFNGHVIPDGSLGLPYFYFYPLTYLWRATPIVLIGLPLAAWGFYARRFPFTTSKARLGAAGLALFALLFTLAMTLGDKKFDRYLAPVYPALDLIAGLGWYALAGWLWGRKPVASRTSLAQLGAVTLLLLALGLQAASALSTFPYYLTYYNPLMGGSRAASAVMQVGWGEGLDEAARYLNGKPGANKLHAISWYSTGSFSYYFEGEDHSFWYTPDANPDEWRRFLNSDYAVIYISQRQRDMPQPVLDYVAKLTPEHVVVIDGIEYARIYKLR